LKETISHFNVEQEQGRQLNEMSRGTFGDESATDFNNINFFQIDADGSSSLIEDWIYDHLDGVPIVHNMAVKRIRYSTGKNVKTVAQSIGCTQKFRSKYVIVTPSIDVVRTQITFKPPVQTALDKHPIKINTVRVPSAVSDFMNSRV
jgi:Flavin containing amine oxidoreductase